MEVPRHWRLKKQRYSLVGEECPHCEEKIFPPRDICPRCGHGTLKGNLGTEIRAKQAVQEEGIKLESRVGVEPT